MSDASSMTAAGAVVEDLARADLYALFARLFYTGPDSGLLAAVANLQNVGGANAREATLPLALRNLADASAAATPAALQREFDEIFIGTGKAMVTPYCTFYIVQTGREKLLVRLRQDLDRLRLSRRQSAREPEDHIAALLEVMRHLTMDAQAETTLPEQRMIFGRYLQPAYAGFCDAVEACDRAQFYCTAAAGMRTFLDIEAEAFRLS